MLMIKAIVRPEKADEVMAELLLAGFPSISKMDLLGRGKQRAFRSEPTITIKSPRSC